MKTILVTGASGMIGLELTSSLLQKGYKVIGTDKQVNDFAGKDNYSFIQCSITDKAKLVSVIEGSKIDAMIHLGITVDNDISSFVTDQEMDDNKACDKFIYKAAAGAGIHDILLLSTTQIYAEQKSREPIRETADEKPTTNYAKLKSDSEDALMSATKKSNSIPVIMRVAPIYTAEYTQNLRDKVYDSKDDVAFVYKDGEYGFCFCCLFNIIDFINGILNGPQGHYEGIYNVCDTRMTLAREILEYERAHHRIGAVLQRNYNADAVKSFMATQFNLSKRIKSDYRFCDLSSIMNNWSFDNTKAQRIATFRWKLANTR